MILLGILSRWLGCINQLNSFYMKHFFFILFFVLCLVSSCNVKKSSVLQSHLLQADSSFLSSSDTLAIHSTTSENKNISQNKTESQITKTTEFNDSGQIIRITEVVYLSEFSSLDFSELFTRTDALAQSSTVITTNQSSQFSVNSSESSTTDSRPVQGTEWLWIIIWIGLGIVLLFVWLK